MKKKQTMLIEHDDNGQTRFWTGAGFSSKYSDATVLTSRDAARVLKTIARDNVRAISVFDVIMAMNINASVQTV